MSDATPVVCCDLDGVLWRGDDPIPGAADAVASLRAHGLRVAFITNNSSLRVGDYVDKLARFGVEAAPDDVMTSAQAGAALAQRILPAGARVLGCCGPGAAEELARAGFDVVDEAPAAAVVVGWHRTFDFERLRRAADAVRGGAVLIATNDDATYPAPGGLLPGNGALLAAVETASGTRATIAGKPYPPAAELVLARYGNRGVMVGDRPSTDGAFADALGWPFALVLSGVTRRIPEPGGEAIPNPPPPFVADDLAALAPRLVAALTNA